MKFVLMSHNQCGYMVMGRSLEVLSERLGSLSVRVRDWTLLAFKI